MRRRRRRRVVAHGDGEASIDARHAHRGVVGAARGVVDGLDNRQVGGGLDGGRVSLLVEVGDLDREWGAAGERPQRGRQSGLGQHRGVDPVSELAQRCQRRERLIDRVAQQGG